MIPTAVLYGLGLLLCTIWFLAGGGYAAAIGFISLAVSFFAFLREQRKS
jgi:hypothetical protein